MFLKTLVWSNHNRKAAMTSKLKYAPLFTARMYGVAGKRTKHRRKKRGANTSHKAEGIHHSGMKGQLRRKWAETGEDKGLRISGDLIYESPCNKVTQMGGGAGGRVVSTTPTPQAPADHTSRQTFHLDRSLTISSEVTQGHSTATLLKN